MYFVKNSISGAQQMLDKILCFHKTKSIPTSEQADAKIICQKSKHCCTNSCYTNDPHYCLQPLFYLKCCCASTSAL